MVLPQSVFRDGIFQIVQLEEGKPVDVRDRLNLIVRGGTVFGSDQAGGVYSGTIAWGGGAEGRAAFSMEVTCELPPSAMLVIGEDAIEDSATLSIRGELDLTVDRQIVPLLVNDCPIGIELTYLGPLPSLESPVTSSA